jgi:hypothetical protein
VAVHTGRITYKILGHFSVNLGINGMITALLLFLIRLDQGLARRSRQQECRPLDGIWTAEGNCPT